MSTLYMFPQSEKPSEEVDIQAAEYVLGAMDAGEAAAMRLRADADPVLLGAIGAWQARLQPMTGMLADIAPPPELWSRLAGEIGLTAPAPAEAPPPALALASALAPAARPVAKPAPAAAPKPAPEPAPAPVAPPAPTQSVATVHAAPDLAVPEPAPGAFDRLVKRPAMAFRRIDPLLFWRAATAVSLLLAIGVSVWAALQPGAYDRAVAAIGVVNAPAPIYLAEVDSDRHLRVTPLAIIAVPASRDLQLWLIPRNSQDAISLGVLPATGRTLTLDRDLTEGTRFIITMEPRGGSPSGRITGQVLYGGTLAKR
jgi:anti-sigma-K factor RskA